MRLKNLLHDIFEWLILIAAAVIFATLTLYFAAPTPPQQLPITEKNLTYLAAKTEPAVVLVVTEKNAAEFKSGCGCPPDKHINYPYSVITDKKQNKSFIAGAGTVIHPRGYIITNAHIVEGKNSKVVFRDGTEFDVEVLSVKKDYDAALLKIKAPEQLNLPYLKIAPADGIKKGQLFLRFGHPYMLLFSADIGVVSSVPPEKDIELATGENEKIAPEIIIRISGTFVPGSSGGPLINLKGEVFGIAFAALDGYPGFAAAAETAIKHFQKEEKLPALP